ncbi:trichohyalin-like [Diachasmimorpha longicaudata]|uniref:trichohyalin-like n=1 Tax=Diachasmimorpha longicaudata TaxID=58733 RepID=UPI0030B8DCC2
MEGATKGELVGAKRGRGRPPGGRDATKEKKKKPADIGEERERKITDWTQKGDGEEEGVKRTNEERRGTQLQNDTPVASGEIRCGNQLMRTPVKTKEGATQKEAEGEGEQKETEQGKETTREEKENTQSWVQDDENAGAGMTALGNSNGQENGGDEGEAGAVKNSNRERGEERLKEIKHWEEMEWRMEKKWEKWTERQKEREEERWEIVFATLEEMTRREFNREREHTERQDRKCLNCDSLGRKLEEAHAEIRKREEQVNFWRNESLGWQKRAQSRSNKIGQETEEEEGGNRRNERKGGKLDSPEEPDLNEEPTSTQNTGRQRGTRGWEKLTGDGSTGETSQTGQREENKRGAEHKNRQEEQEEQAKEGQEEFPNKLEPEEWEEERKERRERRKWIKIRGLELRTKQKKEAMEDWFLENLQEKVRVDKIEKIEGIEGKNGWRIKLEEMESKIRILKRKKELKGLRSSVWIFDDMTERQKIIQAWIEKQSVKWEKAGKFTKVGFQKLNVEGDWLTWDEEQHGMRLWKNSYERREERFREGNKRRGSA